MKHFLDLIPVDKRDNVAPDVLFWLGRCFTTLPMRDEYTCLSFYTQACYDEGLINHWQKYCIDYYN